MSRTTSGELRVYAEHLDRFIDASREFARLADSSQQPTDAKTVRKMLVELETHLGSLRAGLAQLAGR